MRIAMAGLGQQPCSSCSPSDESCFSTCATVATPVYNPGLPVGYSAQTGTVSGNTTGATQDPEVSQDTLNAALNLVPSTFSSEAAQMQLQAADQYLQQNACTSPCPSGWTCNLICGFPDAFVYVGIGIAGLMFAALAFGGHR